MAWRRETGVEEVVPPTVRIGSRVHEYGGGAWCPTADGVAYVDGSGVWLLGWPRGSGPLPEPVCLSPSPAPSDDVRYGDLVATPDGRSVLAVRETHRRVRVERALVALSGEDPGRVVELRADRQFFAAPRPAPDGRLAWMAWDHPDMPWDRCELWVGHLRTDEAGRPLTLEEGRLVDGGPEVSVGQPQWLADGSLLYASDAAGWWQPWRWRAGAPSRRLNGDEAEYHGPDWAFGTRTMAELDGGRLACVRRRGGRDEVGVLDPDDGAFEPIDQPCVSVGSLLALPDGLAWLGATPYEPTAPWVFSGADGSARPLLGHAYPVDPGLVSVGESFVVPSEGGRSVPGLFYAPTAGQHPGRATPPPLVVICHGGPTGSADAGFDPFVQLLTGRGIAVAAVDFAGSTGYGRAFRRALEGGWGVTDVHDCLAAARHLAAEGRVDGGAMAIRGKSSGGLTALNALAEDSLFAGAVSWYGVTDLLRLAAVTHDFERRYTDRLVGPLPEAADEYRRRSPVARVDEMHGAVLLFQGLDDPVVPASQALEMAEALAARGLACRLLRFEGEGHGFRRAETLRACLEAEIAFYQEVFSVGGSVPATAAGRMPPTEAAAGDRGAPEWGD